MVRLGPDAGRAPRAPLGPTTVSIPIVDSVREKGVALLGAAVALLTLLLLIVATIGTGDDDDGNAS